MNKKEKTVIYGISKGDKIYYIGKTNVLDKNNNLRISCLGVPYQNEELRKLVVNNDDIKINELALVEPNNWWDKKLTKVIEKHKDDHPLLNAQWMKDGKRGFWEGTGGYWIGKKRDEHTISRLSESKFKKVIQYDINGYLIKIWNSRKEVGEKVFNDYHVKNGSGCSKIYKILYSTTLKGRLQLGSYWFQYNELYEKYNKIPKKINISKLLAEERKKRSEKHRENFTHTSRYTVLHHINDNKTVIYDNVNHAAYILKTTEKTIRGLCNGKIVNENYKIEYGEKKLQPVNQRFPKYKIKPLKGGCKQTIGSKTRKTVEYYVDGRLRRVFDDANAAADFFKLEYDQIRYIIAHNGKSKKYPNINIKYGKKITIKYIKE